MVKNLLSMIPIYISLKETVKEIQPSLSYYALFSVKNKTSIYRKGPSRTRRS